MSDRDPSPSSSASAASLSSSTGEGSLADDIQQVKGLTFTTIRKYIIEARGQKQWDAVMEKMPLRTHRLFEELDDSQWYPETEMRRLIHAIHDHVAKGDEQEFVELFRGVAHAGISRFFRMILTLASGQFVLRNIPTFWKRLRRGPARLESEQSPDGVVKIHYDDYRYCRDRIYRILSIANCQAAAHSACGKYPRASIEVWDRHSMTLVFDFRKDGTILRLD